MKISENQLRSIIKNIITESRNQNQSQNNISSEENIELLRKQNNRLYSLNTQHNDQIEEYRKLNNNLTDQIDRMNRQAQGLSDQVDRMERMVRHLMRMKGY